MSSVFFLALYTTALAQDADEPATVPAPDPAIAQLRSELQAQLEASTASIAAEAALLAWATTIIDPDAASADRLQAIGAASGEPRLLAFFHAAARSSDAGVAASAAAALGAFDSDEAVQIAAALGRDASLSDPIRGAAVQALITHARPDAGEALWLLADDRSVPSELRRAATEGLAAAYPEILAERGSPESATSAAGAVVGVLGHGLAGGIVLSSVGTWGRNDAATAIGAVGGSAIAVGTGVVYSLSQPITTGQGLRYTSNVGWGLTGALLTNTAVLGPPYDPRRSSAEERTRTNLAALIRSSATAGGAYTGWRRFAHDPQTADVLESDLAGYLGLQLGVAAVDMTWLGELPRNCYSYVEEVYDDTVVDPDTTEQWSEDCADRELWYRTRSGAAVLGGAAALAAHARFREAWQPGVSELAFSTVTAAEAAWIGGWLPQAFGTDDINGNIRLGLHGGASAGLIYSHFRPVTTQQATLMGWGMILGNALGAGVPLLADVRTDPGIIWPMLGVGLAGTAGGAMLSETVTLSGGDAAMLGVGLSLATAESAAIAYVLDERLTSWRSEQSQGLVLTGGSVAGLGLTGLSYRVDPRAGDMFFLGTAAAWGGWYGFMTPLALQLDGDTAGLVLSTTITGDAFLALGGLAISPLVGLDAQKTLLPQLLGVTGATVGALVPAMVSTEGHTVAMGALVGSTVGLLGGGAIQVLRPDSTRQALLIPRPLALKPPGTWSVQLTPTVLEDDRPGLYAGISARGL